MAHAADHTVLFGGVVNGVEASDTWVWTGSAWVQPMLALSPPARFLAAMAYDRKRDRVVLFGGHTISGTNLADTWEWDGVRWTALAPPTSPSARFGHRMVYDPVGERIVLFGGASPITLTDTWAWDGTTWTELPATATPNVSDFALTWDAARQELQVYDALANTLWVREPARWRNRPLGGGPPPRTLAAVFRAPDGAGLVVDGGYEQGVVSSDQWELQWAGTSHAEVCTQAIDADGDGLVGCADLDCWSVCTPWCPPGASCDPTWPRCGDGVCNPDLETCRSCSGDCACTPLCGDLFCDPGEDPSSCPGDCP
ncbi:MAG: kelch repeat-containing protein [Proteobacteria bacterium]|nr:kelch repeat-containing protein [Pseudomonadota bacterium]